MAELHHGGRLREAAGRYGIPLEQWLDLSTGINPHAWPVPPLPVESWQRLPEQGDGLEAAATAYYGSDQLLPLAGSQAAIQALPRLRPRCRVGVLMPGYAEHAAAWQAEGHEVVALQEDEIGQALPQLDVLVVINPNNPTGVRFSRERLLTWHERLEARGGWLVVDEAFIDATPGESLVADAGREGLVVLRSLGKFFGLAGARVGFCFACSALRQRLGEVLGPWAVSGPAREVARQALSDADWQAAMRLRLQRQSGRLHALLEEAGLVPAGDTALFAYCATPQAAWLHQRLARQGVLTRLFTEPSALRFGLPAAEANWQRLQQSLSVAMRTVQPRRAQC
ncbi:MAG: threonine-phosphate decarboxylase CobD [Pseudomonadota bacterium]